MGAAHYRFRADRRSRWRGWVLRGLLYGLAGSTVLAAVSAARRTDSAYDRFLASQNAYDVLIPNQADQGTAVLDPRKVVALPQVSQAAIFDYTYLPVGTGEAAAADPTGQIGRDLNRFKILEGRTFDPDRRDEAVVSFAVADYYGIEVGDHLDLYDPSLLDGGKLTVVGIEASPGEFPPHFPGEGTVHLSPALSRTLDPSGGSAVMVRLVHGAADVPEFLRDLGRLGHGQAIDARTQQEASADAQRSIHLQAVAFWILAAVLALTALTLVAQVEARATHAEDDELPILGSLGMSRRQRAAVALRGRLVVAVVAAGTAVLVAYASSPLTPVGLARIAEPDLGLRLDGPVLLLGALALVVLIPLMVLPAIWVDLRRGVAAIGGATVVSTPRRQSVVAASVAATGAPPPIVTGVRLALEPGGGRDSVPVRSTLLGVTLALVVLAAAATFAASLNHLLDNPRLYGLVWDTQFTNYGSGPSLADEAPRLRRNPRVEAVAVGESGVPAEFEGHETRMMYLDALDASALPPAIDGRAPTRANEIGLGARTADRLGAQVGDEVTGGVPGLPPARFRVSGILVMPSGQGIRLGEGALITRDGTFRMGATERDLTEDLFVRLAPGADPQAVASTLPAGDAGIFALPLDAPSDVVNFGRVDALPAILGLLLAFVAASALTHTLMTAARRRRRELAVLKTLGFVSRQVRSALAWQSVTLVTIALAIGIPVGVAAGRAAWTLLAKQLGVIPVPIVPVVPLVLLVPAALGVGLVVALVPGRIAAHTPPANVLRVG